MRDTLHIDGGGGEREVRAADFDLVKELHTRDLDELHSVPRSTRCYSCACAFN